MSSRNVKQSFTIVAGILLISSCASSPPKKSQHSLADLLLDKKSPSIGVPSDGVPSGATETDSRRLMEVENQEERIRNQSQDQDEFQKQFGLFKSDFMQLMKERRRAIGELQGAERLSVLEGISMKAEALILKLTRYFESPGTMAYYQEGQEREFIFRTRHEKLEKLESNWRENLAYLQADISELKTKAALESLSENTELERSLSEPRATGLSRNAE